MKELKELGAGKGFKYLFRNKIIKDKSTLKRIRSLVIPPAWKNVWICRIAEGHLQATGLDVHKPKAISLPPDVE